MGKHQVEDDKDEVDGLKERKSLAQRLRQENSSATVPALLSSEIAQKREPGTWIHGCR